MPTITPHGAAEIWEEVLKTKIIKEDIKGSLVNRKEQHEDKPNKLSGLGQKSVCGCSSPPTGQSYLTQAAADMYTVVKYCIVFST